MMKRMAALTLCLMLALSLGACGTDTATPPTTDTATPPTTDSDGPADDLTSDARLQEEILLMLGAKRTDSNGREFIEPYQPSLYYSYYNGGFADGAALSTSDYYTWYLKNCDKVDGLTQEEREEKYAAPAELGEYAVNAYPAAYFEPAVTAYFGVTAEQLRQSDLYYPQYDCYWEQLIGGRGECPELEIYTCSRQDDLLILHLSLVYNRYYRFATENAFMVLTVRLLPDGGWQYLSYLPDENVTEPQG